MVYQLQRPSIEMIIDYCRDLLADEKLEVYEFGQNCDLVLHIYKDGEYSPSADKDIFNMVRVHTARDGEWVDDADDIDLNTRRFLRQNWNGSMSTETLEYYKTKEKNMRIKDLIEQLSMYEENSEVIIYDDDKDREYEIAAIDADEGDESDNDPQIMIIF